MYFCAPFDKLNNMFWTQEVLKGIDASLPQLVNDSKTPSGEPHVGSLRGVLIHDAIYKVLKANGLNVRYTFGSDDYDPVDEIPKGQDEHFRQYLGFPLCNTPAPAGSEHSDMAEHFISGFFKTFDELGVEAERYRMRDVYRSGQFNDAIEAMLNNSDKIREIYKLVSGSEKSAQWFPFQSICENCGRIGTTEVIDFDGKEVTYVCRPDMVTWAQGCGYKGKRSPFNGEGKLPWKLEWVAKWMTWGITIEGAGMDHSTKGGSRDVSGRVLGQVFGKKAPYNVPYGFFLVGGAKMSSSKGIGSTAKEMAEFLSPEMLRYLMLATPPKRAINFDTNEAYMVKMYNDFDTMRQGAFDPEKHDMYQEMYFITEPKVKEYYFLPPFSLVKNLIQLPHINISQVTEQMKGSPLNDLEKSHLQSRIDSALYWLDHYAEDDDKFTIQQHYNPEILKNLTPENQMFLYLFRQMLDSVEWNEAALQQLVFDTSRLVPTLPKNSFNAVYQLFLGKDKGPQVGSLLYYLDKEFVHRLLNEVPLDPNTLIPQLVNSADDINSFLEKEGKNIVKITAENAVYGTENISTLTIINEKGQKMIRRFVASPESVRLLNKWYTK